MFSPFLLLETQTCNPFPSVSSLQHWSISWKKENNYSFSFWKWFSVSALICWFTKIKELLALQDNSVLLIQLSFFGVNLWYMSSPGFMKYQSKKSCVRLCVGLKKKGGGGRHCPSLSLKNLRFQIKSTLLMKRYMSCVECYFLNALYLLLSSAK